MQWIIDNQSTLYMVAGGVVVLFLPMLKKLVSRTKTTLDDNLLSWVVKFLAGKNKK